MREEVRRWWFIGSRNSNHQMRIIKLVLVFLVFAINATGQGYNHQWLLGNYYFLQDPKGRMFIDNNSIALQTEFRKMPFLGSQANISDVNGNLLMASNGIWIANATGDTMLNGGGLNPSPFTSNWMFGLPISFSNIFLSFPNDSINYLLIHSTLWSTLFPALSGIYYTKVDLSLDGGLGGVSLKNDTIFSDSLSWGIGACRHANGRDWWIITQELESSRYLCFLLTSGGIYSPKSVVSGLIPSNRDYNCNAVFSKDGSIYATCFARNFIQIFDFDRCSGQLSNSKRIYNEEMHVNGIGFIELSADNHYLYLSSIYKIWQYDLTSSNIMASEKVIGLWDTMYYHNLFSTAFYTVCRAPDDQIYASCYSSNVYLHKISFPNRNGDSCDFRLRALTLPEFSLDLPQSTNYNLGALPGSGCDSLSQTMDHTIDQIHVYPNPAQEKLLFNNNTKKDIVRLKIYNVFGLEIANMDILQKTNPMTIDISNFENGTYFYSCTFKNCTSKCNSICNN